MVATKEIELPIMEASDAGERLTSWSTSKNIGILILTLVVLAIVSSICIRYSLAPKASDELRQNPAVGTATNADALIYRGK
jgi:hypothetical protein